MHQIQFPSADGMTLADIVFPAFLFLVGVSSPLAFERAQAAGKSKPTQARSSKRRLADSRKTLLKVIADCLTPAIVARLQRVPCLTWC